MRAYERLITYARVSTASVEDLEHTPSTQRQFDLANLLAEELKELGAADVFVDEHCYVYARIPATAGLEGKTSVGFLAHVDTIPDFSGENVQPRVIEHYDGSDIPLGDSGRVLRPADFPHLKDMAGKTLVITDGTTVLGADDKAGVAEIMTMAERLLSPDAPAHGPVCIGFCPDEEIGHGAALLDLDRFGAELAYTLDGDYLGYYEDETFNASQATLTVRGRSVHTGTAKGIMLNAADVAGEFMAMLPRWEKPQYTEGREGFFHVVSVQGACERAEVVLIVRDHDSIQFAQRENYLRTCAEMLRRTYGPDAVQLRIEPTYRSMKEVIDRHPYLIENLTQAIRESGLEPRSIAFRGGTDGSALSHRGLPCPNLSAGYENAHGRFEYVPIRSMEKNVEILLHLCARFAEMR